MQNANYLRTSLFQMSRTVFITRRERFSAAHKLHREDWSKEKTPKYLANVPTQIGMVTIINYLSLLRVRLMIALVLLWI